MENHHAINGETHYKWSFSIAMLNYQRVKQMETWDEISTLQKTTDWAQRMETWKPQIGDFTDGSRK